MSLLVESRQTYSYKRIPDIDYVSPFDKQYHSIKHKLDIYAPILPPGDTEKRPCCIFAHGGGWKKGDRYGSISKLHQNIGQSLASRGYIACVISYRMSSVRFIDSLPIYGIFAAISFICSLINTSGKVSSSTFFESFIFPSLIAVYATYVRVRNGGIGLEHPAHTDDFVSALYWTVNNIENFGGDSTKIALMGHSAGAHMAMMLALTKYNTISEIIPKNTIRAIVCLSGVYSAEYLLNGTHEDPKWLSSLGYIAKWYRRIYYLRAVFGIDESKWSVAFPCGLLDTVLKRQDNNKMIDETINLPTLSSSLPFPFLFINCKNDWGLHIHTEHLMKLLDDVYNKTIKMKKIRLTGGNHVSYLMDISHKGRLGEDEAMEAVDEFLTKAFES